MVKPIINIFRTKEEALLVKSSQIDMFNKYNGVQLLPNNLNAYVQVTDTPDGLDLEDWTVKVLSVCGDVVLGDITTSFMVDSLTNSTNGNPQVIWSLTNVPLDCGIKMVYLKITQAIGETFYTQPFILSDYGQEKTTQFYYKDKRTDDYQSIGFKSWYRQDSETVELTTYYETSTQNTVTQAIKVNEIEIHRTELMSIENLKKLSLILRSPYLYVNSVRASLFQAVEMPKLSDWQNFGQFEFQLSMNENDIYAIKVASLGDFDSNDWAADDWLIYQTSPIDLIHKKHNNKFNNIFG